MLLHPYIFLFRKRILWAAIACLAMAVLSFLVTSSEDLNPQALWHHACTCPFDTSDTRLLLDNSLTFFLLAILFGFNTGPTARNAFSTSGPSQFLLTRPQSRLNVLLAPLVVAATAISVLPGLAWLLLLGWLTAVHAPAHDHLTGLLELIPSAAHLGPHPGFFALAAAAHLGRFYLAGISLGLSAYVVFSSSRWLTQSRFRAVKTLGFLAYIAMVAGGWRFIPRYWLFMFPKGDALTYVPSAPAIAVHFAFAAAWFCANLWILRDLEL
jgi:hypothetical protein